MNDKPDQGPQQHHFQPNLLLPAFRWNSARGGRRKPQKPRKRPRTAPSAPCKVRHFGDLSIELTKQFNAKYCILILNGKTCTTFLQGICVGFCQLYRLCGQTFLQRVSSQESSSIRHLHHAVFHFSLQGHRANQVECASRYNCMLA